MERPRFCRDCGTAVAPGDRFCRICGRALASAPPAPAGSYPRPAIDPGASMPLYARTSVTSGARVFLALPALLGSVAAVVGTAIPWIDVRTAAGSRALTGFDLDQWIVVPVAVITGVLSIAFLAGGATLSAPGRRRRPRDRGWILAIAIAWMLVVAVEAVDIRYQRAQEILRDSGGGWVTWSGGLWMIGVGALLMTVAGASELQVIPPFRRDAAGRR